MKTIYWTSYALHDLSQYLFAHDEGLVMITLPEEPFEEAMTWIRRKFSPCRCIEDEDVLRVYCRALTAYWDGEQNVTSKLTLSLEGTDFQCLVWQELLTIPYGETVSYQTIADRIGRPKAVRAVANAIAANPIPYLIPCHRVIGKNGALTGYRGGLALKRALLDQERKVTTLQKG